MERIDIIQTPPAATTAQDGPQLRLVKIGPGIAYSMMPVADNLLVRRRRAHHRQLRSIAEIHTPPITDAERQSLPLFTHHPVEAQDPNPLTQEEKEFLAEYEEEQRLAKLSPLLRAILDIEGPFHHQHHPAANDPMMQHSQPQLQVPTPDHQMGAGNYAYEHQSPNTGGQSGGPLGGNDNDDSEDGGVRFRVEELEAGRKGKEQEGI